MNGLWWSHHETLHYACNFSLVVFHKLLSQSLSNRLDVCKERSACLVVVAQFLSQICLRVKANLFSGRITVVEKNIFTDILEKLDFKYNDYRSNILNTVQYIQLHTVNTIRGITCGDCVYI